MTRSRIPAKAPARRVPAQAAQPAPVTRGKRVATRVRSSRRAGTDSRRVIGTPPPVRTTVWALLITFGGVHLRSEAQLFASEDEAQQVREATIRRRYTEVCAEPFPEPDDDDPEPSPEQRLRDDADEAYDVVALALPV